MSYIYNFVYYNIYTFSMFLKKNTSLLLFLITSLLLSGVYSCKQVKMSDADLKFQQGEYSDAAAMYRKIYRKTPSKKKDLKGEVSFKMAESYRLMNYVGRASSAYGNAERFLPTATLVSLQYARTLHKEGKYKQAAQRYSDFLKKIPDNQFAESGLRGTEIADSLKKNPTKYTVKRMDLFNSRRSEFSPAFLPPEYEIVYLTSSRDEATGDDKSSITGLKHNDIFSSRKDENGKWLKPEKVEGGINTEFDEGATGFSPSGNTMYYTYCPQDPELSKPAQIYSSTRSGGSWSKGTPLKITRDTISSYAHPSMSPNGEFLYFVSDMPGGYGGKDIWRAYMIGDMVEYHENLGPEINTAGDEVFPFMRTDSTLYFSSDGHPGMGGLDIFKGIYNEKTKKWKIENMDSPINSQADDFGMTFERDLEKGYFSSNRNDGKGSDHIYSFEYPVLKVTLEGFIVDKDDEFVKNATIRVVGNDGRNDRFNGRPDGTYNLQIDRGTSYVLLASAEGYLNSKMELTTMDIEKDSVYYVDFVLFSLSKPSVLENIFYDFDRAALRDESKKQLDELITLMEINPNVTIELSSHTDRKGSQDYNQKLSQRRAQSVVDYLIQKGIKQDRLVVAGYGKAQPKTVTKNIVKTVDFLKEGEILTPEFIEQLPIEQQEVADQINRRTEFKVLSVTYGLN